ncbi:MAG: bifunctional tRNA (5-methylaminomethyl-2-thiouridine)(34)-methyltransferase MnmD/FAD-dependent 5-carboxymethylaminomethyl-2-thiouridine(34) oxidoreductase MnmC [Betaproteobacteria bacterium]|nr:bifunctional tRNA (5-methylaminomethyl-2-thiouridine)(34)-methyltransferase MnmD/FAD-dependent 5-carboxymethylaminomethyl-2-thiouridine(34) oxidoreductase MnmC [Betaproteobacteria bacterium]MDH5349994.1 bifunctional tRNA (5-methylaminomethyl-2-thiouridine)(34)-methyltransferase MnmD/FAD-dependent 5-carboxymethylaminomethyl-2-thiouridine(34) oxidoreductase MnmC [Betaproteobacteria bacterium]
MTDPLIPARLAFAADGTPFSPDYDDVYHSADGGAAQAHHVFLAGNGLPARWQDAARFTILETGFGFGLSFLAAWHAWQEDPRRSARLHFVSVEKHPFSAQDLAVLHAPHADLAPLASELRDAWPMLVPGLHRLEFAQGRVVLTLAFGDAAALLPQLRLAADAVFLDGFAPAKNPDMWSPELMKAVARLCAPGATAATWSVATPVRESLRAAGFAAEKRRGFARKSEMLVARFVPPRSLRPPPPRPAERSAAVVGAGIAGAAVGERLAARGWEVTLVERHLEPALEASGNHAGTFHPVLSSDDSHLARLTRAAFTYLLEHWRQFDAIGAAPEWRRCGVLQLARDAREEAAQQAALEALAPPLDYAQRLDARQASACAGVKVAAGGLWFPEAGWIRPRSYARALLRRSGARLLAGREVAALEQAGTRWILRDREGESIVEAGAIVLANAADAMRLAPSEHIRLRRVRGQLTYLPPIGTLRCVLLRGGMVLPPIEGITVTGASFDLDDTDPSVRAESHEGNLERLERIVPGASAEFDPRQLAGRTSFRTVARDRLPLVGPLEQAPGLYGALAFGSRGLLWAGLGAELLASQMEGEPLPLEVALADALAPARFALKARRRAGSTASRP